MKADPISTLFALACDDGDGHRELHTVDRSARPTV
jgi:hypothetical protein